MDTAVTCSPVNDTVVTHSAVDMAIMDAVRDLVIVLDAELRVAFVNKSFCRAFQVEIGQIEGRPLALFGAVSGGRSLKELLLEVVLHRTAIEDCEIKVTFPTNDVRTVLLNARAFFGEQRNSQGIVIALHEIAPQGHPTSILTRIVQTLSTVIGIRDPLTANHHKNVTVLSTAIGGEMGLSAQDMECLAFAASLHDIGKIMLPMDLLQKPDKMSLQEIGLIQSHVDAGYDIIKGIGFPGSVAEVMRQHHERLDGSGYPQGLKGSAILLGARILAIADVVESMMSHRPYRPALNKSVAIAEIQRGRGSWFDPTAVDACVTLSQRPDFAQLVLGYAAENPPAFDLPPTAVSGAFARMDAPAPGSGEIHLTLQQSAVMQLVAEGKSVKEIARQLNIAIGTVKTHLAITYKRLGARNRMEAVVRAGLHSVPSRTGVIRAADRPGSPSLPVTADPRDKRPGANLPPATCATPTVVPMAGSRLASGTSAWGPAVTGGCVAVVPVTVDRGLRTDPRSRHPPADGSPPPRARAAGPAWS